MPPPLLDRFPPMTTTPPLSDDPVLETLEPGLRTALRAVLRDMAKAGHPMRCYSGRRTVAQQQALFAKGRTVPGAKVTFADGVKKRSRHQDGVAADCAFVVGADGRGLSWEGPWHLYGGLAEREGLVWGGRWEKLRDRPHVELPE